MNFKEDFPLLNLFFYNAYHVDWREDYDSEESMLKASVYEVDTQYSFDTIKELDQFISLGLSEPELRKAIVDEFGSGYYAGYALKTVDEVYDWLYWIRDMMTKYTNEKIEDFRNERKT